MTAFDPYYHWLGIRDAERPPNHYRLLGLEPFEEDTQVISVAADRQMAHLRTFQNGPHAAESQQLLNEVALARVCLLDEERKRAYDQQLLVKKTTDRLAAREQAAAEREAREADARPKIQVSPSRPNARPASPSVTLGRPGRGNRDQLPRWLVVPAVIAVLLFCGLGWWYRYRVDRSASAPMQARRTATDQPSSNVVPEEPSPAESSAEGSAREAAERAQAAGSDERASEAPGATNVPPTTATAEGSADRNVGSPTDAVTETSASEDTSKGTPGDATQPSADASATKTAPADSASPKPSSSASPNTPPGRSPDWNPVDLEVPVRPLAFRATDESSKLVASLGQRELEAVRGTLNSWLKPNAVVPAALKRDDLHLVFDLMDEFWSGVDAGLAELQPGARLMFRSWEVTVHEKTSTGLVLEMKTGKRHAFDVRRAAIHRDLAVAIVEHHHRDSLPTAYRMAGLFLMLDRQGDVELAKDYLGRAEAEGFSTGFILDAVRRLVGSSVAAADSRGDRPGRREGSMLAGFRTLD